MVSPATLSVFTASHWRRKTSESPRKIGQPGGVRGRRARSVDSVQQSCRATCGPHSGVDASRAVPRRDARSRPSDALQSAAKRHVHAAEGWAAEVFPQNGHERREDPFAEVDAWSTAQGRRGERRLRAVARREGDRAVAMQAARSRQTAGEVAWQRKAETQKGRAAQFRAGDLVVADNIHCGQT